VHTIRAFNFSIDDYQAIGEIVHANGGYDKYSWIENLKHSDRIHESGQILRQVAEVEGQVMAYASCCQSIWFDSPGKYWLTIEVHPKYQTQNIGQALYHQIANELMGREAQSISTRVRKDDISAVHFYEDLGFEMIATDPVFALDLATFEESVYESLAESIEILSLSEWKFKDPQWLQKWWQLECQIAQDLAEDEEPLQRSLAQFEIDIQHPAIIPEGFFFAQQDNELIGISGLTQYDERTLQADLTWVVPNQRGKGIARALKLKTIEYAVQQAYDYIIETVEDDWLFHLNTELGFCPLTPWNVYEKAFGR